MLPLPEDLVRNGIFDSLSRFAGRKQAFNFSTISVKNTRFPRSILLPPSWSSNSQHLQGYTLINRSKTVYLIRNKIGSHEITTTQGHLCSLPIRAIYSQPATVQAAGLSSTGLQCYLSDLNTIGCSACEASLSNILWSGGCSEWSSSARAALHLCRSRAWSPASHMTCWFLSVCTRDCRILATAS